MAALVLLAVAVIGVPSVSAQQTRDFQLDYSFVIRGVDPGKRVNIWVPVPESNAHQQVTLLAQAFPGSVRKTRENRYGNRMLFGQAGASGEPLQVTVRYHVVRHEVRGLQPKASPTDLPERQRQLFLQEQRKVPLSGPHIDLLQSDDALPIDPVQKARQLYQRVDDRVRYDKSRPGYGQGDAAWVCRSRCGNCTDFHSLFIAWARSVGIPAKFEIGFPLPPRRGSGEISGYHCWGYFHTTEHGWVPVDISEADKHPQLKDYYFGNLTENRVAFSTGRDIDLVPRQASPALNYFVYPHVEVDGKQLPDSQLQLRFRFRDRLPSVTDGQKEE